MAHIHTSPGQHDFTVSAYIIRTDFKEPKLMLHMHKKLGKYMQFGGHVELDEDPWQALTHELLEEAGYTLSQLQLLQPHDRIKSLTDKAVLHPQPVYINTHPIATPDLKGALHYHIDIGYAFVANNEPSSELAEDESSDIVLLTKQELLQLPEDKIFKNVQEICCYILDTCLPGWEQVSLLNR